MSARQPHVHRDAHAEVPRRRWHHKLKHSLRHSLRWRLVALFLLLALAMSLAFVGGTRKAFSVGWRDAVRPLLIDYVDRLAAEIGSPPDAARARALAARLPISVRIEGPVTQFDSHPQRRTELWREGEHGLDEDSRSLLRRKTPDGHIISFGAGSLDWRRGPGIFAWVTLGVLLALTALAYAVVRRLLKPLDDIGAGAQRFGAGDFSQPIAVRSQDELGDLAGQINTMGQDIHEMLEAKRGLLLAISHELRSPLTRARLNTELLPDTGDSHVPRAALLRDLALMTGLINDLLESERLSGSHAALNREVTDLAQLVRDAVAEFQAESQTDLQADSGVHFVVTVAADLPLIPLDTVRIRLLLHNLLDNAARHGVPIREQDSQQYSQTDKANLASVAVSLSLQKTAPGKHESLQLNIRDFGPGVTASQLSQLAEPFFRADAGRQRSTGGVGLGLYLCRLVAQAHGGSLQIQNAQPGLEVTVKLPLNQT